MPPPIRPVMVSASRVLAPPMALLLSVGLASALATPTPLQGQIGATSREAPPRLHAGGGLAIAQPLSDFSEYVSVGGGIHAFLRVNVEESGRLALRIHGGFLNYGNETQRVCLSETVGCRIEVDLTTSNNIFLVGAGPELAVQVGSSRLYGNTTVGFGYFSTDSRVAGTGQEQAFASTRNFGDGGLSWNAGGGVEIPVARARQVPLALDLGLSYQGNGRREYLTRGGITDRPDGSLEFDVKRSDADFLLWRIGISAAVGRRAP
jgi:hypothetical protein